MRYKWTIKEIRDMVSTINELSMKHGTGRVELQEGSQLYGRSWRLYRLETGTHALFEHPYFSNYLGDTKREAGNKLDSICQMHVWNTHKTDKKCCPTCGQKVTV